VISKRYARRIRGGINKGRLMGKALGRKIFTAASTSRVIFPKDELAAAAYIRSFTKEQMK
jgi:DNA invertase Pin-like site-specific DNA recombinase